jgi:hypothetical protein
MSIYAHYTIYKITNLINNKVYIGQTTTNPDFRWKCHRQAAASGKDYPISRAIRKYGIENFTFDLICSCFDLNELNLRETYFILFYRSNEKEFGYNCDIGGNNKIFNKETREKMKLNHRDQSGSNNPNYDHTKYHWFHIDGREEMCTKNELKVKYNLKGAGGWSLFSTDEIKTRKKQSYKLASEKRALTINIKQTHAPKYHWYNIVNNQDVYKTKYEMRFEYNLTKSGTDRVIGSLCSYRICHRNWCLYDKKDMISSKKPRKFAGCKHTKESITQISIATSGRNNPRYDPTIYHWVNCDGREEFCSGYELRMKHNNITFSDITSLKQIKDKKCIRKGWYIIWNNKH